MQCNNSAAQFGTDMLKSCWKRFSRQYANLTMSCWIIGRACRSVYVLQEAHNGKDLNQMIKRSCSYHRHKILAMQK